MDAEGVADVERITDGREAVAGSGWRVGAARFEQRGASVTFDLKKSYRVRAAYLQADNNDVLQLSASEDGEDYVDVWTAGRVEEPGLQGRSSRDLDFPARFVRLTAVTDDSEFRSFSSSPRSPSRGRP